MRIIFGGFFTLHAFGPLVGVPAYAYAYGDWFLLLGLFLAYLGVAVRFVSGAFVIVALLAMTCLGIWLNIARILDRYAFFFLVCATADLRAWLEQNPGKQLTLDVMENVARRRGI